MISRLSRYLYRKWPVKTRVRRYYGQKVYLPRAGYSDRQLQKEGAYEAENCSVLCRLAKAGSWVFDVGTNLGLMSIPVLASRHNVRILSFEPSENALRFLRRTVLESAFRDRWELVTKCVGAKPGSVSFTLSAGGNVEYDGLEHTGRVRASGTCQVEMTTLDVEWHRLGRPRVSVIKCDVEGGEIGVLQGAVECLTEERPFVVMEWNECNFGAYNVKTADLLDLVEKIGYEVHSLPNMVPVRGRAEMELQMLVTENFLLSPRR